MFFKKMEEEPKQCDHEECYECHHLIAICELHKKPYDRFESKEYADYCRSKQVFEKRVGPWKRVNEDGTDYVEKKSK